MDHLLFGAAYYDEYMPYDRLDKDIDMMKKAGINVVRIAESTWSTCEPSDGVFDFAHVIRVMDAMEMADISVIIGTPTYAIPAWMAKAYPDVIATTSKGKGIYGARQIMDITEKNYLFHAERVIRELMKVTAHRKCVIGFQLDNETKYYDTAGINVQKRFVDYLKKKFDGDLEKMNDAFGLDYWSNRINSWEEFPDVRGTINGSLGAEFDKFRRSLVTDFLKWQAGIVNEYRRDDQFITHNFDYDWRGYSYGVQPFVDHFKAAESVTVAGCDIYHPSQVELTGEEISFGGDIARSLKNGNYLVLETEAQGFPFWTPYKGQLRLQAFSHIASGANSVMYWHWHSIHNSYETYWKGLLSHDFAENDTYLEACTIGKDFQQIGEHLVNLKKNNEVAVMVSNDALTALEWFGIEASVNDPGEMKYNDVFRWIYNTLYHMNVECDIVWPESTNLSDYKVIIVPAMYTASEEVLNRLNAYVANGGTLVSTFKTGFADENVKVYHDTQPHIINPCLGVNYNQFAYPKNVCLKSDDPYMFSVEQGKYAAETFMEFLKPTSAKVLLSYDHYNYESYAAVTENSFGKGMAYHIGCMMDPDLLRKILKRAFKQSNVPVPESLPGSVIMKRGRNDFGKEIIFLFNYSENEVEITESSLKTLGLHGEELLTGNTIDATDPMTISRWGIKIIEK